MKMVTTAAPQTANTDDIILQAKSINAYFGAVHAVKGVNLEVRRKEVHALIGPSGCGKSTFIRTLNRMHEEVPGAKVQGEVWLAGTNIYGLGVDAVSVRR